ncbi:hypothetical protein ACHQM5_022108 [Ranunculus cassubicifolius]
MRPLATIFITFLLLFIIGIHLKATNSVLMEAKYEKINRGVPERLRIVVTNRIVRSTKKPPAPKVNSKKVP